MSAPRDGRAEIPAFHMTDRDEFAGRALQGMLAHSRGGKGYRPRIGRATGNWHYDIAVEAYEIADAMLAAREAKP